jgi:hypothetical protein
MSLDGNPALVPGRAGSGLVGAILPITIAVYELADGETAVVVSEPFAPVLADRGWREAAPRLARLADQESQLLARALSRLQREASRYAPPHELQPHVATGSIRTAVTLYSGVPTAPSRCGPVTAFNRTPGI